MRLGGNVRVRKRPTVTMAVRISSGELASAVVLQIERSDGFADLVITWGFGVDSGATAAARTPVHDLNLPFGP